MPWVWGALGGETHPHTPHKGTERWMREEARENRRHPNGRWRHPRPRRRASGDDLPVSRGALPRGRRA